MSFSGRSAGDRIHQILRSGGWFTLMQRPDESGVLKIDLGSTRCWRAARAIPGLLAEVLQRAWSVTRERKTLIKCEANSCCEHTIETSKMLRKPVTFRERSVISLCASQICSLEVGQRIVPLPILWAEWGFFFSFPCVTFYEEWKKHLVSILNCISFHFRAAGERSWILKCLLK